MNVIIFSPCHGSIAFATQFLAVFFAGLHISCADNSSMIQTTTFTGASHCPGQVISWANRYDTSVARSAVECVSHCRPSHDCLSVVFDKVGKTCYLSNGKASGNCSNMIPGTKDWKYYEKRPIGQGEDSAGVTTNATTDPVCDYTCRIDCQDTSCGNDTCRDCEDLKMCGGATKTGKYWIKPPNAPEPFLVYCQFQKSGKMLTRILNRYDLDFNFNRTWMEYRDGFGQIDTKKSFWLGLEKIHQLTTWKSYQVKVIVNDSDIPMYKLYDKFVVAGEAEGYSMNFSYAATGKNLGDCLSDLRGASFSTYDMDNDGSSSVHCAFQHGGGWWFKGDNCSVCNPLGPILPPYDGYRKGVLGESFWGYELGDVIPFRFVMLMSSVPLRVVN